MALVGGRAFLLCDPASSPSVSASSPSSSSSSSSSPSPSNEEAFNGANGNNANNNKNINKNINNADSLVQVIIWYKGNTTGSPIYSIDAPTSGGSLHSAEKFPSKSYGRRLSLDLHSRPLALVIDPVRAEDEGDYFCRMVSPVTQMTPFRSSSCLFPEYPASGSYFVCLSRHCLMRWYNICTSMKKSAEIGFTDVPS